MRVYAMIMHDIESQMEDGAIRGGQKLPSIRETAEHYACSKSTVIRAYAELEKRHLLYSVPQSGYYAVVKKPAYVQSADGTMLNFSAASPDPGLFPYLDFQHCLNKAIDMYRNDLFAYGTPQGLPSLLQVLSKHLAGSQVFAKPEQMVITSGVQQSLSILAGMPFPNGKRAVLLEQPTYHNMIQLLETLGIPALGIERTDAGIDLDRLEHLFRTGDVKLFYTIPRFHNPLGTSYSEDAKKTIAELAARYDVYVAEDDYLLDLVTDSKSDPIHAYASSHVIYLRSFSKIMFPGLRIGAAVLPPELLEPFSRYKRLADIDSSMLSQAALKIYFQSGMFERRKHKIVTTYGSRMERLRQALEMHNDLDDVRHPAGDSGVHTYLTLPDAISMPALLNRLERKHLALQDFSTNFLSGRSHPPMLKLSITRVEESEIDGGIRVIFEEIRRTLRNARL
ncbi:PLP-dependent aminotransferase family protein [Paenibacillus sacheonensis]|uniref:Aminotransferase class I/II-fold pyridoxal phosphate-dependent enzyme n=1 Tax=Paenibacillus sacheonensis TaxID=742054 RepID=A0A7X4YPW8_9BACL|nr:PLP-dependent aminotransferase family protein [Paenibacillus sacheonensis]MBM7566119.1 DNA-binding transcriptional MocR family regulator [Paenibacillus sacheonensis]NBC70332.1 aminotransferase class I/II-fold pyridoxal phosphate-dependent enzyme [Paenibacillus sacheonensis]